MVIAQGRELFPSRGRAARGQQRGDGGAGGAGGGGARSSTTLISIPHIFTSALCGSTYSVHVALESIAVVYTQVTKSHIVLFECIDFYLF